MPLTSKAQAFREFKAGDLHSGKGGPVVTSHKQAVAIALNTERRARRKASSKSSGSRRSPSGRR